MKNPRISEVLKTLRTQKGCSQKQLAQALNVAQNTVSNWENGTREPDVPTITRLANYFGVSIDYLIGVTPFKNETEAYHSISVAVVKHFKECSSEIPNHFQSNSFLEAMYGEISDEMYSYCSRLIGKFEERLPLADLDLFELANIIFSEVNLNEMLATAESLRIYVYEENMPKRIKGLCGNNVIWLNKRLKTNTEKTCIMAEELGHYHTTTGNILDQSKILNRKQERLARGWAYTKLVPMDKLIAAYKAGATNRHELAEYLGITEDFLIAAIKYHKEKHGLYCRVGEYWICWEPLGVLKNFEL